MKTATTFDYTCPECERGTMQTTRVQNHKTRIKGYPFVVDEAVIGVCDRCGARAFAPEETRRWEVLFSRSLEAQQAFCTPKDIADLRNTLGLTMEDFARLIGSTRQSVAVWERDDRSSPPLRTADLLMKLLCHSLRTGPVDVPTFLLDEVRKWGVVIELQRPPERSDKNRKRIQTRAAHFPSSRGRTRVH
jgi:putative zinc finger/helix-turn-helix YgiT family protein